MCGGGGGGGGGGQTTAEQTPPTHTSTCACRLSPPTNAPSRACAHPPSPAQAIQWAWELSTVVYGLPRERVWVSVYEEDEEALALWRDVVGVDPARIRRMGAADNFWASGPTGACVGCVCGERGCWGCGSGASGVCAAAACMQVCVNRART
jgi:hypothetical protein